MDGLPSDQRGPLHGIPISVKECNNVKNCDSTAGMCQFLHQPCQSDNLAVCTMKKFGAVPFCLTNVPQSMYSLQCSNPPYGTTGNAFNPAKETGGSSGGEGSLIGSGGSILGSVVHFPGKTRKNREKPEKTRKNRENRENQFGWH